MKTPYIEKVITGLVCCSVRREHEPPWNSITSRDCRKCPYNKPGLACTRALAYDALELLKAQEPIEPVIEKEYEADADGEERPYFMYYCAKCNHYIEKDQEYCDKCGQAVKWE